MNPAEWDATFGPAVGSPDFLDRAERVESSPDPDQATYETVAIMCVHIHKAAADPLVIGCARDACQRYRGGPLYWLSGRSDWSTDPAAIAESCWWWAKHALRFVHHSKLIYAWLNETDQLQLLIAPDVLVRMRKMQGDCAIYTMLICAFLEALKVPWDIVTLACNRSEPTIYSHVYPRVILPDGRRVPLDASHGSYPGWEVPARDQFRKQVYDMNGQPVADAPRFDGLHGYVPRAPWGWGVSGLGDDTTGPDPLANIADLTGTVGPDLTGTAGSANSSIDLSSIYAQYGVNLNPDGVTVASSSSGIPSGSVVVPSQSSAAWAAAIGQLGKMGFTLAEINAMQPGTVVNPNGQIVRQATGYPVTPGGASSLTSAFGLPASSNLMTIGLVVVLGVVLIGALKK